MFSLGLSDELSRSDLSCCGIVKFCVYFDSQFIFSCNLQLDLINLNLDNNVPCLYELITSSDL